MLLKSTRIEGVMLVSQPRHEDERGWFQRRFCEREFADAGLEARYVQHSLSRSLEKGTLRGMHYQIPPHGETKLVSCLEGTIFDVVVDLRPGSPTRLRWQGFELGAANGLSLYIPAGVAHGFLSLTPNVLILYLISEFHAPEAARGLRYDDPAIGIEWPAAPAVMSDKDRFWPLLGGVGAAL